MLDLCTDTYIQYSLPSKCILSVSKSSDHVYVQYQQWSMLPLEKQVSICLNLYTDVHTYVRTAPTVLLLCANNVKELDCSVVQGMMTPGTFYSYHKPLK